MSDFSLSPKKRNDSEEAKLMAAPVSLAMSPHDPVRTWQTTNDYIWATPYIQQFCAALF
jgi:hypothetical protein